MKGAKSMIGMLGGVDIFFFFCREGRILFFIFYFICISIFKRKK